MATHSLFFQDKSYSPFYDYFGLASVVRRIVDSPVHFTFSDSSWESSSNSPSERDTVLSDASSVFSTSPGKKMDSKLNPLALPFSPVNFPQYTPPISPQSPVPSSTVCAPGLQPCAVSAELRFKLRVQRCRAAQNKDRYRKVKFCVFCRKSGQPDHIQNSHVLKREDGRVCCPYLRAYVCPTCGATGDDAHTIKYCPATQPKIIFT